MADISDMQPLAAMPMAVRRGIRFVLTDIDDTLTTDGRLTAASYAGLERLSEAGFEVVPITGRPAGWCDLVARFWPVRAVVGENGAFYFRYDRSSRRMSRRYWAAEAERRAGREKLAVLQERILAAVPGAAVAADQAYRVADLAIDIREDVVPLPRDAADRIVEIFEAAGARAKVSSIHVNGWFGDYDKLAMTKLLFAEVFGIDLTAGREGVLFIGDSPNDAPMFEFFTNTVAVANIREFADRLPVLPAYVTQARSGAGFVELAEALLASAVRSGRQALRA
jgi:HAD superfamily hydrolase (TIGR01484 family)